MPDFAPLTVAAVHRETPDAVIVDLVVPDELRESYRHRPGQHLAVRAVLGGQELRRTYSICSARADRLLRIAIKRVAGGGFSNWANDELAAGHTIESLPPAGRFVVPPGDGTPRHLLAFAAGAGITPVIGMVREALETEPETRVTLVYGNRTPETILFSGELEDLKDRHLGRFTLLNVLSRNEESDAPLFEGRITADKVNALADRLIDLDGVAHVFLCGPGSFIKETRNALIARGVGKERIHHEFFAPGGGAYRPAPKPEAAPAADAKGAEAVAILDGVRRSFKVPAGQHVVDAALAAGIRVPYSCKGGMCCTCRAKVVEGSAEMTVNYSLEPWEIEAGFILTCQAVPTSARIVLDYDQM
ncbi:MAG: 2Fe-2S iron-sulfur cluster-binding protein [Hyphomicrobiaceae bacterium]